MPARTIAFLRAINVGGHNLKMNVLRSLFMQLELANVETLIASGNVIFDTPADAPHELERRIEQHLQQALGYAVATFVRSAAELATPAAFQPFPLPEGSTLHVGFLAAPPGSEAERRVLALQTPIDQLLIHGRELYWLCHKRVSESALSGARLERALGMPTTLRNITTVRKLVAKYGE